MIPDAEFFKIALQGGSFVLVAWLVTHVFRHTLPRLADAFDRTINVQRAEFLAALEKQRVEFREEIHLERGTYERGIREVLTELKEIRADGAGRDS